VPVDPTAPCIIGVARHTWREEPAPEPLDLWEAMARAAADDAGAPAALASLQSLQVVYCQSWEYDDPCGRLATRLGADPSHRVYSGIGGSVPVRLVGDAARAMTQGELDLALVVGGESLATRRHLAEPPWSHPPADATPFPITLDRDEAANGIFQAYLTFALLDTARRADLGHTLADHRRELGALLAPLTEVAAAQPEHAWFPLARTAEEITTPTVDNRRVATPYTKLMTAIMDVDMAAAVLLATTAEADRLGVPTDRRVYLHGLGAADEPPALASRPDLGRSPALATAVASALGGTPVDDVAHLDLYSCFASSLSFASDALALGPGRSLTVTGGLPYHGGPGSNYGTHALAAMIETLRADPGSRGLVTGIGMHMEHHTASLWSASPADPGAIAPVVATPPTSGVPVVSGAEGPATVVTYSTEYDRNGPTSTALVCDLPDGSRAYARLSEPVAEDDDLCGTTVRLTPGRRGSHTAAR
jgi:acetyl-CoA C-acetyltransferase